MSRSASHSVLRPRLRSLASFRRSGLGALALVLLVMGSLAVARNAHATPEYPGILDQTFGVNCPLPNQRCLICHTTARGGQTTAVQPFAQTLRGFGLTRGYQGAVLTDALDRLPDDSDSDDDGVTDRDELLTCGNPSGADLGDGPAYGCDGAHLAPHAGTDMPSLLVSIVLAGLLVRGRRQAQGEQRER